MQWPDMVFGKREVDGFAAYKVVRVLRPSMSRAGASV